MINRTTKLRWRRRFKQRRTQVENLGVQTEDTIERHFFKRLSRLSSVRRFIITWIALVVFMIGGVLYQSTLLSSYYKTDIPVGGGTFTEGILGTFTNANPLYATGPVDSAVAQLLFSGLLKYDASNKLVGDLAAGWSTDETETIYTVKLRPGLVWQDGKPLTAKDVAYTYKTIQNPDTKSPLLSSWQGITVTAVDDLTVTFALPSILSSFQYSLTNGIVPEHVLAGIPAAQLRATQFNTSNPIGSGPFKWNVVEISDEGKDVQGRIGLVANDKYYQGKPDLQRYVIRYFTDENQLLKGFEDNELNALSGIDSVPDTIQRDTSIKQYSVPITAQVMVFFRTSQEVLADVKVRQALVQAADQSGLLAGMGYPVVGSQSPFLPIHVGYNKDIVQLAYNREKAAALLTEAGWLPGKDGIREKAGKQLTFNLYSQSTSEYAYVTQKLQNDWKQIGVKVEVLLQADSDLQTTVAFHNYDALLYGISLGPDPDVYAYWGSTQADERAANRVNFSEYKSTTADRALEAGRTRSESELRSVKYRPFLEAWKNDAPALALYQPRYLYITRDTVYGFDPQTFNSATDRYSNVANWKIRTESVDKLSIQN